MLIRGKCLFENMMSGGLHMARLVTHGTMNIRRCGPWHWESRTHADNDTLSDCKSNGRNSTTDTRLVTKTFRVVASCMGRGVEIE